MPVHFFPTSILLVVFRIHLRSYFVAGELLFVFLSADGLDAHALLVLWDFAELHPRVLNEANPSLEPIVLRDP